MDAVEMSEIDEKVIIHFFVVLRGQMCDNVLSFLSFCRERERTNV
jgi:hypothetical protein